MVKNFMSIIPIIEIKTGDYYNSAVEYEEITGNKCVIDSVSFRIANAMERSIAKKMAVVDVDFPIMGFFDEKIYRGKISRSLVYDDYVKFCSFRSFPRNTKNNFYKSSELLGVKCVRRADGRYFIFPE
jgi:hypothetical protein